MVNMHKVYLATYITEIPALKLTHIILFNYQIGKFMNSNLDFFSTKSGIRTRGLTTAATSEVTFASL